MASRGYLEDGWLGRDGKVDAAGDEAAAMGLRVELARPVQVRALLDADARFQDYVRKSGLPSDLRHLANGAIFVGDDDDRVPGRQCQVAQRVTGRQRPDEEIFRIVTGGITAKGACGGEL